MGTEATLIYNVGVISWIINLVRRFMGVAFGIVGTTIYQLLEFTQKQVLLLTAYCSLLHWHLDCIVQLYCETVVTLCHWVSPEKV